MAVTKASVIRDLDYIKNHTLVKFKSFGLFYIKLMQLPIRDQGFITRKLRSAAVHVRDRDMVSIISFSRIKIKLSKSEQEFRFMVEHDFMCTLCGHMSSGESNCSRGFFQSNCEICQDQASEHMNDSIANQLYD